MLFILSDHKWTGYVSRFLTGACQVFLLVYYPVWIDKFGYSQKTLWLTLLQIGVPLGIFCGYGMTSVVLATGASVKYIVNLVLLFFLYSNSDGCLILRYFRILAKIKT